MLCVVLCCLVCGWVLSVHRARSLTLTSPFHSFHTHSFTPRDHHLQSLLEPLDVDGYRNLDPAHTSPEELENGRGEWPSTVNMYNDVLPNPRTRVKLAVRHHFSSPRVAFSLYYIIRSFFLLSLPLFLCSLPSFLHLTLLPSFLLSLPFFLSSSLLVISLLSLLSLLSLPLLFTLAICTSPFPTPHSFKSPQCNLDVGVTSLLDVACCFSRNGV
jgi:hypothetical protein